MRIAQTASLLNQPPGGVLRRAVVPSVLVMFFLICAGTPPSLRADPITFVITWTLSSGAPAPAASTTYTYDSDTALYTGFVVTWNGREFDFASTLNTLLFAARQVFQESGLTPGGNEWVGGHNTHGEGKFWVTGNPGYTPTVMVEVHGEDQPPYFAEGTYTVTQAAASVPEPATLTLCGIGVGGLFITRYARSKRRKRSRM